MSYFLEIEIGDPSHDGHNQSEKFFIQSNRTEKEILQLTTRAKNELALDFDSICRDYQEDCVSEKDYQKIVSLGIEFECWDDQCAIENDEELSHNITIDEFFKLWMNTLKHIDQSFEWSFVETLKISQHFGYGLFSC